MNNEPVAWINLDRFKDEALYLADCVSENKVDNMGITTPLYTHPVKEQDESFDRTASHMAGEYVSYTKELTDEEIQELAEYHGIDSLYETGRLDFARAILRKAQEK